MTLIRFLAMGIFQVRGSACSFHRPVDLPFIAIFAFQFSVVLGQDPSIFQFGMDKLWGPNSMHVPGNPNAKIDGIWAENLTSIGDFRLGGNLSWIPGAGSHDVSGKWLYKSPVQLSNLCNKPIVTSFSTMFQFSITLASGYQPSSYDPGAVQGLAFIIVSDISTQGEAGGYLGWLNSTTDGQASTAHNFAVEVDFHRDLQFHDPSDVHIGVDKNSLTSLNASSSPEFSWLGGQIKDTGQICATIWIDYNGRNQILEVFETGTGGSGCKSSSIYPTRFSKPTTPIISTNLDLSDTISHEGMFVGFSGSISSNVNRSYGVQYTIEGWTFNSDGPAPDLLRNSDGSAVDPAIDSANRRRKSIIIILLATIPSLLIFFILVLVICLLYRRNTRLTAIAKKYEIEINLLDQGPQNFKYRELSAATKKFNSSELLGSGGFGSVYRGNLLLKGDRKPTEVAVKRISSTSKQGAQEFSSEVKIIGRAQHRNLVRLLGWCHERDELLLVYDYMPNGSVDHHLYQNTPHKASDSVLTWSRRLKIVSGVAAALTYLHEEWEYRVIHRDIKSSNVMLDHEFKARLGDFGLARMSEHNQAPPSTAVLAGTYGYLAPELVQTLKATEKTDVYSFGALVLEVATGKRPILSVEDRKNSDTVLLIDWVWDLYRDDSLLKAADCRLQNAYDPGEMSTFLKIGLLCSHPNPDERPDMREVTNIWKGLSPFPPLPRSKPVPVYALSSKTELGFDTYDSDTTVMFSTDNSDQSDLTKDSDFTFNSYSKSANRMLPSVDDSHSIVLDVILGENTHRPSPMLRHRQISFKNTSLPF